MLSTYFNHSIRLLYVHCIIMCIVHVLSCGILSVILWCLRSISCACSHGEHLVVSVLSGLPLPHQQRAWSPCTGRPVSPVTYLRQPFPWQISRGRHCCHWLSQQAEALLLSNTAHVCKHNAWFCRLNLQQPKNNCQDSVKIVNMVIGNYQCIILLLCCSPLTRSDGTDGDQGVVSGAAVGGLSSCTSGLECPPHPPPLLEGYHFWVCSVGQCPQHHPGTE